MEATVEAAISRFLGGYNCAQAIVSAFRQDGGLSEDMSLKMATGLGAGMARKQEICGAVTGGIIVLGLRHGRGVADDPSATERTYQKTQELMDRFAAAHGSCLCRKLLEGYDLGTESGRQRAKADDIKNKVCKGCVQRVAEILEQIR